MSNPLEAKIAAVSAKSRGILIDAAVCFVATSLVAVVPAQWKNPGALPEIAFTVDPVSGKIIDRIESAQTERPSFELKNAASAPAIFTVYPQDRLAEWSDDSTNTQTPAIRPMKVAPLRKASLEKRNPVESTPPAPPTKNAEPPASAQSMGESVEELDRSLLAKLDPTGLPSKLAPLGRKAWNGATALGGWAVSSLVSAYHF